VKRSVSGCPMLQLGATGIEEEEEEEEEDLKYIIYKYC
jgi:hypothetical protein